MANELCIYTTPPVSDVRLKLDNSSSEIIGMPGTYNGRADAHLLQIPAGTTGQGAVLTINHAGYLTFSNRGLLIPSNTGPALFYLDDVHMVAEPKPPEPPKPQPPPSTKPIDLINGVYATGLYDLSTKEGCGQFTEACCTSLHDWNNTQWGHIKKEPAQNQYNGHAVDAVMCLAGPEHGIWDIIFSSASSDARPVYNRAGDAKPELWYYPA
jgi:hypothetical protein